MQYLYKVISFVAASFLVSSCFSKIIRTFQPAEPISSPKLCVVIIFCQWYSCCPWHPLNRVANSVWTGSSINPANRFIRSPDFPRSPNRLTSESSASAFFFWEHYKWSLPVQRLGLFCYHSFLSPFLNLVCKFWVSNETTTGKGKLEKEKNGLG